MDDKYAALRLKNQLCFPLYAVSKMCSLDSETRDQVPSAKAHLPGALGAFHFHRWYPVHFLSFPPVSCGIL